MQAVRYPDRTLRILAPGDSRQIDDRSANLNRQLIVRPPQQRLYFFPEPHGHGSFLPILPGLR
jgi:hypothetical protein